MLYYAAMRVNSFGWALGVGLLAVGLGLVLPATPTRAQGTENCPNGFTWERTSGQCCVQDRTTIPPHGKIGYTGNSLCEDGWYEVYDRRPTTNGEGPPGCPGYTSFVFLLECDSSPEEAQRRQAEVDAAAAGSMFSPPSSTESGGGSGLNPLSDTLYGSGGMPSPNDLALAGGAAAALLATLGLSTLRGSGGAVRDRLTRDLMNQLKGNERAFEEAQRALDKANEERKAIDDRRTAIQKQAKDMQTLMNNLATSIEQCNHNISIANAGKWTLAGLGLVAAIASFGAWALAAPAAVPAAAAEAGSFEAALGSMVAGIEKAATDALAAFAKLMVPTTGFGTSLLTHFQWLAPWQQLKDSTNALKANAAFVQGRVQAEVDNLNRAYDAADAHVKEATANLDRVRTDGTRISQQMASP